MKKPILTLLTVLFLSLFTVPCGYATTWGAGNYSHNQTITLENTGDWTLIKNTTVAIQVNVTGLNASGKAQNDTDDIRIVCNESGVSVEKDRFIDRYTKANFTVYYNFFRNLTIGEKDDNCSLYYGSANATTPPQNLSRIWIKAPDHLWTLDNHIKDVIGGYNGSFNEVDNPTCNMTNGMTTGGCYFDGVNDAFTIPTPGVLTTTFDDTIQFVFTSYGNNSYDSTATLATFYEDRYQRSFTDSLAPEVWNHRIYRAGGWINNLGGPTSIQNWTSSVIRTGSTGNEHYNNGASASSNVNGGVGTDGNYRTTVGCYSGSNAACVANTGGAWFKGIIDQILIIHNGSLTDAEALTLTPPNHTISWGAETINNATPNAAIFVTDLNVSDFQLASSTYVSIHNDTINVSITRKFGLFNFMVANKMGSGGPNLLTMRVLIDGVSACEKDLVTLDTVNEYEDISGCLVDFVLTPGTHSLTFQAKRSGSGTIDITNYKAILYEHLSNANSNISDTSVTTGNLTTFNTSFNSILNININKTSSSRTFHYVKITVESNDTETADFYLNDTVTGEVSPFVSIYIADDTAKGSVFIPWASSNDETSHIVKLYVRSRGGQLINVSNITVHNIDLKDALGNVINATEITNATTNLSRGRLIGASTTETIIQRTIRLVNGTSLWIAWSATINSSQKTSPIVETFIVGQPHSTCFGRVRETLVAGGTNGNIFDMIVCNNLTPGNSYLVTFNVTTESGKPIRILDEMVTIVEGVTLNISEQNLPPLPNTILAPANGSTVTQPINVTWRTFTDPDGDAVTYNVTLWNSSGFIGTISDNLTVNLTLFDITGYLDSTYIIKVEGCDPLLLCSHSNSSFTISLFTPSPLAPLLRLISNAKAQASTILTEVSQFIVLALYLILAAMAGLLLSLFANMMLKGG